MKLEKSYCITIRIGTINIDYRLLIDAKGELLSVQSLIDELPKTAKKLILGKDSITLKRKIIAYKKLIKFILPLLIEDRLPHYKSNFSEVVLYLKNNFTYPQLNENWKQIESLITNVKSNSLHDTIRNLTTQTPSIATDFLPAIIPLLTPRMQRIAFKWLGELRVDELEEYLLAELSYPFSTPYASGILSAIGELKTPSNSVFSAITTYYYRNDKKEEITLGNLIMVLSKFPREETKNIGLDILKRNKDYSVERAADVLLFKFNMRKEVADVLLPHFVNVARGKSEAAFSIFCNRELTEFLPDKEIVFNSFIKSFEKGINHYSIPNIARKTGIAHWYEKILLLLENKKPRIRKGVLILLDCLIGESEFAEYKSNRFTEKYMELVLDQNFEVAQRAINLIKQIGQPLANQKNIDLLLKVFENHPKNNLAPLSAMKCINSLLHDMPYPSQITPFYLAALEEDNDNYRIAGLNGLRFSPDIALKKELLRYKNDANIEVREIASSLFNPIIDERKVTALMKKTANDLFNGNLDESIKSQIPPDLLKKVLDLIKRPLE